VLALKRAGFAGSRSRTALWEIPTSPPAEIVAYSDYGALERRPAAVE
jgi:hypothetical protein